MHLYSSEKNNISIVFFLPLTTVKLPGEELQVVGYFCGSVATD